MSRKLNLDPETILRSANNKFISRWKKLEKLIKKNNKNIKKVSPSQLNSYWEIVKKY